MGIILPHPAALDWKPGPHGELAAEWEGYTATVPQHRRYALATRWGGRGTFQPLPPGTPLPAAQLAAVRQLAALVTEDYACPW